MGDYRAYWKIKEIDHHDYKKVSVNDGKKSQFKWVSLCEIGTEINLYFDPSVDQDVIKSKIQLQVE